MVEIQGGDAVFAKYARERGGTVQRLGSVETHSVIVALMADGGSEQ